MTVASVTMESTGAVLKEWEMNTAEGSLRLLVEKWFAPTPDVPVSVTRFSSTRVNLKRCVRVESMRAEGSIAIFFFRHDDGTWCVFPPRTEHLAMRVYSSAA
jgi:hypothetical protein